MAVIDETWDWNSNLGPGEAELFARCLYAPDRTIMDWGHRGGDAPNEEDGKLLASVPELLRKIRDLEHELDAARDG